jgi:hypothetical protein
MSFYVGYWHLASFRCDAEFGPLSAHIEHRVATKLDLWVRALVSLPQNSKGSSLVTQRSWKPSSR